MLRLHRKLLGTCCAPDTHPVGDADLSAADSPAGRAEWHARVVELLGAGADPCVPRHALTLPGGVPLVGAFVPPGSFLMGGSVEDHEQPVHTVTRGLFMGVHPVTQDQWHAVMGTGPSHFKGPNRPVEQVSWDDAQQFCAQLTGHLGGDATVRLPTEAEWEWACRAGTTTEFRFGYVIDTDRVNYNWDYSWNDSPLEA